MVSIKCLSASILTVAALTGGAEARETLEVLHWWTSASETKALKVLQDEMISHDITLVDTPVSGGAGMAANSSLRLRMNTRNPPAVMVIQAFDIREWAREGVLATLDDVALQQGWEETIPEAVKQFSKVGEHWYAAPINIHITNWMWINKRAFDRAGGKAPQTFDELIGMLDHFEGQGLAAIAAGGEPWQDATLFDAVVLSLGVDFYRKALIELDPQALGSHLMRQAFERMGILRGYVDSNFPGRPWNLATEMVIEGKGGVQFMGDWAKGEFLNAEKDAGVDYICLPFPETEGAITFVTDQFAMFKLRADDSLNSAQAKTASSVVSPDTQVAFNVAKGSTAVRLDASEASYDHCGKMAASAIKDASRHGRMLGSLAHGHAVRTSVKNAIFDVVTRHFNGEINAADAVQQLVVAVEQER